LLLFVAARLVAILLGVFSVVEHEIIIDLSSAIAQLKRVEVEHWYQWYIMSGLVLFMNG